MKRVVIDNVLAANVAGDNGTEAVSVIQVGPPNETLVLIHGDVSGVPVHLHIAHRRAWVLHRRPVLNKVQRHTCVKTGTFLVTANHPAPPSKALRMGSRSGSTRRACSRTFRPSAGAGGGSTSPRCETGSESDKRASPYCHII